MAKLGSNQTKRYFTCYGERISDFKTIVRFNQSGQSVYRMKKAHFDLVARAIAEASNGVLTATLGENCITLEATSDGELPKDYSMKDAVEEVLSALNASCTFLQGYDPHYFRDHYVKHITK